MKNFFILLVLFPFYMSAQAEILNAKKYNDIQDVSKNIPLEEGPLEYPEVSDDDILFYYTTWEVIDLNQRVNFPLYYPTELSEVTGDRKPLIYWLLRAVEDTTLNIPAFYDSNLTDMLDVQGVENLRAYKELKQGREGDNNDEGEELFYFAGGAKPYFESLGHQFPADEDWHNYDPWSPDGLFTELQLSNAERATEINNKWRRFAAYSGLMDDSNFILGEFEYKDVRKYLIKGIWYFDKKDTQLRYRPIAIGPVAQDLMEKARLDSGDTSSETSIESDEFFDDSDDTNALSNSEEVTEEGEEVEDSESEQEDTSINDDSEYDAMFWIFYPEVRDILHRAHAFNDKNMSKPISFDRIINSRRFSSTIYKESNVYQDRDIREYIKNNSLMQLIESERIKEKIRNKEQDMWSY